MISNPGVRSGTRTGAVRNYMNSMMSNMSTNYARRRREEALAEAADEVVKTAPLKVTMNELYIKDNAKKHFTGAYELVNDTPPTPVLRRGFTFHIALRFDRPVSLAEDGIKVIMDFGPTPSVMKGTKAILPLVEKNQFTNEITRWDVRIQNHSVDTMTLEFRSPITCQVGIWHCTFQTYRKNDPNNCLDNKLEEDIYMLFNPWCKDDTVYMPDDKEKKEYILNETGKVWMGSYRKPKGRRWIFGQFDDVVLPTVLYLLELSELPHSERGNSVLMARAISAIINSADEDGLIVGRWDGDYKDGTPPYAWTGSIPIMEQYLREGGNPVKYGQCWVFSALVVTVCRALGIPCRSVTNYVSAHDTNASLTVDKYFDKEGNEISGGPDGECYDSCWNFHVWNDVWMARPDLPPGYGGWQVIDATPQEESDSLYRCGPASKEALRQGKVGFLYDTPFVFAEVNADVCHFQEDESSDWGFSRLRMNNYHVGRRIVTKKIDRDDDSGDSDQIDITNEYKDPEGSHDERLAVFNAVRGIETAHKFYDFPRKSQEDVEFELVGIDHIKYGQPFSIIVHIKNNNIKENRHVEAILSASTVYYTGVTVHKLKKAHAAFKIPPNSKETLRVTVTAANYLDKLVDHCLIKVYAIASVRENNQTWTEEDDFPLVKPKMDVRITGKVAVGQKFNATFSFTNPISRKLTGCYFLIEGPGLLRPKQMKYKDVEPDEVVSIAETFSPKKTGSRKIVVSFNSNELTEILGVVTVQIQ